MTAAGLTHGGIAAVIVAAATIPVMGTAAAIGFIWGATAFNMLSFPESTQQQIAVAYSEVILQHLTAKLKLDLDNQFKLIDNPLELEAIIEPTISPLMVAAHTDDEELRLLLEFVGTEDVLDKVRTEPNSSDRFPIEYQDDAQTRLLKQFLNE
jgi:hypothetical protein